jgi:hypothetical protein
MFSILQLQGFFLWIWILSTQTHPLLKHMLRTTTHTKTGNNTGSLLWTATHTKLGITLEASKLESITLKERKLEVILILEKQIQLVLTRARDKVLRSFIYTAKILLETPMLRYYWKVQCWKVNYTAKILLETPMLRYYWKLQCWKVGSTSQLRKVSHYHCYCHVRDIRDNTIQFLFFIIFLHDYHIYSLFLFLS